MSAPEKTEVLRQAEQYLRTRAEWAEKDGKLPPIPAYIVSNEVDIRFLFAALRDIDDPGRPLVEVANYERFRVGLVDQTIDALTKAHAAFMASEYPEIVSATDMRKLEEQAKENDMPPVADHESAREHAAKSGLGDHCGRCSTPMSRRWYAVKRAADRLLAS